MPLPAANLVVKVAARPNLAGGGSRAVGGVGIVVAAGIAIVVVGVARLGGRCGGPARLGVRGGLC